MIPLAVPNLEGREKEYLNNCINTTYVSSVGEYVNRLEKMCAEACGSIDAVATSSGTTGLHAALSALGVGWGDLVILPTFTFIASANAVAHCGASPWLMDIDNNWTLDPGLVKSELEKHCEIRENKVVHKKSGRRVAAIMPVYTLGNIPDMAKFRKIADEYKLPLIADAACAIGATYYSRPLGTLADVSVLSFNGNKTITCGGGGMVIGNDEALLKRIRHLTTTARVSAEYDFDMVGFNYRMTNIQAAVGCAQMERLDEFIDTKRRIRQFYSEDLGDFEGISFFPSTEGSSCWFSGIVLGENDNKMDKIRFICNSLKDKGIEARSFWKPVHMQMPYKNAPKSKVYIAEDLWDRIITLPCSTNITEEELRYTIKSVKEVLLKMKSVTLIREV